MCCFDHAVHQLQFVRRRLLQALVPQDLDDLLAERSDDIRVLRDPDHRLLKEIGRRVDGCERWENLEDSSWVVIEIFSGAPLQHTESVILSPW